MIAFRNLQESIPPFWCSSYVQKSPPQSPAILCRIVCKNQVRSSLNSSNLRSRSGVAVVWAVILPPGSPPLYSAHFGRSLRRYFDRLITASRYSLLGRYFNRPCIRPKLPFLLFSQFCVFCLPPYSAQVHSFT